MNWNLIGRIIIVTDHTFSRQQEKRVTGVKCSPK